MLQNIWDATILTGGVSMQREPMSTELMTLTPLTPAAHTCYSLGCLWSLAHHWPHCLCNGHHHHAPMERAQYPSSWHKGRSLLLLAILLKAATVEGHLLDEDRQS